MEIYVSHSRDFDFRKGLYLPLRASRLNEQHHIILPHENSEANYSSAEFFRDSCKLVVAEVSFKGTGLGIELGWANAFNVPIIAIYKRGIIPSRSISSVTKTFVPYSNPKEMVDGIEREIDRLSA